MKKTKYELFRDEYMVQAVKMKDMESKLADLVLENQALRNEYVKPVMLEQEAEIKKLKALLDRRYEQEKEDNIKINNHIQKLKGALQKIASGTEDMLPPFRAMGATQMKDLARKALK